MAYQKLQAGRALEIITSDTLPIPTPNLPTIAGASTGVTSGTANDDVTNQLVDTGANFLAAAPPLPVVVGDRVISIVSGAATPAVAPIGTLSIPLGADIFPNGNETYAIVKINHLIVSGETFITKGVSIGDIVWNTTAGTSASVTAVNSEVDLTLSVDLFGGSATFNDSYKIFVGGFGGSSRTNSSEGCVLYAGTGGDIRVLTVGGDDVVLKGILTGQFVPVQVLKVFATNTTASNLIALW